MKKLAVVLAAIMMLSTTTFLAAESISTNVGVTVGNQTVSKVETAEAKAILESNKEAGIAEAKAAAVKVSDTKTAEVVAMVMLPDMPLPAPTSVTFEVQGLKVGETVVVSHKSSIDGSWETFTSVVKEANKVTIDGVTNFSPFYIAKVVDDPVAIAAKEAAAKAEANALSSLLHHYSSSAAAQAAPEAPATEVAPEATLPKTGAVVVLPFAAMACLAGAVVCGRKEK